MPLYVNGRRQVSIPEVGPEPIAERAQFFTPPALAMKMAALAREDFDRAANEGRLLRVLEPSAGRGALVHAIREVSTAAQIDAIELDPRWAAELKKQRTCNVYNEDYLLRTKRIKYDLIIANPPYNGGEECAHIAKMMNDARRIILHIPTRSMHGLSRWGNIWSRIGEDWWIRKERRLRLRPKYTGSGGTDEIIVLDLQQEPGLCDVEWW